MNRNRMLIGVVIALIIALLASHYVYQQIQKARVTVVKPIATSTVVVAAAPLEIGTPLQPKSLRLVNWPAGTQPQGTFSNVNQCLGRALITSVVANEPILEQQLAPKEAGPGLPAAIPEGMRAVSVRVDDVVDVAGFVQPGTMVDVLVTGGAGPYGTLTRTFLEDVRVLAAGQQVEQDQNGKPHTVNVVTLLVSPQQADTLTLASTEGSIHLALRNTIDTKVSDPRPVYLAGLYLGGGPVVYPVRHRKVHRPRPQPPAPTGPYVVEIYQGDKRETASFPSKSK
jgi:pilus assembly protein CpaB